MYVYANVYMYINETCFILDKCFYYIIFILERIE